MAPHSARTATALRAVRTETFLRSFDHPSFGISCRSLMRDVEAVNRRLKTAEDVHRRDMEEQEGRSNHLQERLVETRTSKEEVRRF